MTGHGQKGERCSERITASPFKARHTLFPFKGGFFVPDGRGNPARRRARSKRCTAPSVPALVTDGGALYRVHFPDSRGRARADRCAILPITSPTGGEK